jgi:chromosome segregation ATPase
LTFDFGYLVVLGAVVVILFVYRQLDKNNRSLEKIRQFAETVRRDLNTFVEERTATVKDFETVLKVHDKTAVEILKRIQAVESNLLARTPEIEDMQARLDRYAASMGDLEAQTKRLDANLGRLKEETAFVDRVSQRIKGAADQMATLEKAFVQIRQEFTDINQKDLDTVRKNTLETFERETLTYVQQLREAQKQVEGFHAEAREIDSRRDTFIDDSTAALDAVFRETARQAEDLSSVVFVRLEERIETQARDSETRLRGELAAQDASLKEGVAAVQSRLAEVTQSAVAAQTSLEALEETFRDASVRLRQDFQGEQAQLLTMTAQLKSDLDLKLSAVRTQVSTDADALRSELQKSLELDRQSAQALVEEVRQFVAGARQENQQSEQKTLEALEARLKDYEATFAYRYGKMEEAEKDLSTLDQNLRQAMERVAERIQRDFAAFDEAMGQRRQEEQASLELKIEASKASIVRLDKDLEELKVRAYDNVSEKLQGFEEEFFEDLQKRTASMTQSLEDWQSGLKAQLDDLKLASERDRAEAERVVSEALKLRVQELQNSSFQQLDRLEKQIHEAQEAAGTQVKGYHEAMEATGTRLGEELAELEKALASRFEQDRAKAELAVGESLTRVERELETRVRALGEGLDQFKGDYQNSLTEAQADIGLWRTKLDQRFKELDADFGEQYRSFKASVAEKIAALSDEFSLQKDELTTRTAEERTALRTDLAQIRTSIDELDASLRSRAQAATDAFEREYEALSQDMQKKNRELVIEVENRLRDYRASVTDTKEKAESMQKRVFGKIEDQANLLNTTIEEIEKRQKSFITQTKVFERADTLKQELQEAIEDLKGDLARIEVQRKDLFEIETSIARVKKLGDETSEKAAKFTAEKKRIDLMDSDFQRILGLSQSMELRLEQVTSSHDLLQDIQLRIRKLEDYSKDIEVRYERLEKRREVLDNTTDGVDRNFALLDKVEKAVRGLDSELKAMPAEVEDLRKRLKTLAQGKDDADKAVERLITLDQTLRDVESRIGRMEQAREWIAGVETRLSETRTAAEEQVHTLATITKAAGGPAPKGKGADADLRQTVLKLARQGWGKEEISRATKLSLGEVELILELGTR